MMRYRSGNPGPFKVLTAVALAVMILGVTGCQEDTVGPGPGPDPDPDPDPQVRDCERYGTARVTFRNGSSRSTYTVLLDGVRICTLGPGQTHTRNVAAGRHTVQFNFANTGKPACSTGYPSLAVCECTVFTCSSDY